MIWGFKSVYGMEILSGLRSKADLAAKSDFSFPLTLMWLGIQHMIISLWLDIESSLLSSLTINGFSSFLFLSDVYTERASVTNRDISNKYTVTIRNKFNTLQEITESHTTNDEYENFLTAHIEVVAECILIKPKPKCSGS